MNNLELKCQFVEKFINRSNAVLESGVVQMSNGKKSMLVLACCIYIY